MIRIAKCLDVLRAQIEAAVPAAPNDEFGWVASAEHHAQNPNSDHEADADGVVKALDIPHYPKLGLDTYKLADHFLAVKDPRFRYIISNGRIAGDAAFVKANPHYGCPGPYLWGTYDKDKDQHEHHMHMSSARVPLLYDDARLWDIGAVGTVPAPGSISDKLPELKFGSRGDAVRAVQQELLVDGIYGRITEQAVKDFQKAHGLAVDGIVGPDTWAALGATQPRPPTPPIAGVNVPVITALAAASPLARVRWTGQGVAPIGYIKGMAVMFATCLLNLQAGDPATVLMAKANTDDDTHDALSWYNSNFRAKGWSNAVSGPDTLRHLFVLMLGLGMRESSGKHCEGRDTTAAIPPSSDSVETGLFQMSWDAHVASAFIPLLVGKYSTGPDPMLAIFSEDVTCSASSWANFGSGAGAEFQKLCKKCPGLAVETAAVGLRVIRKHWGPINRKEAELRVEADDLLQQVQRAMTAPPVAPAPAPVALALVAPGPTPMVTLEVVTETAPATRAAAPSPIAALIEEPASPPVPATSSIESVLNMNDASAALLRYALIAGFTGLAVYGYMDIKDVPATVDKILPTLSALSAAGTTLWGIYINLRTKRVPMATAMRADVPTVSAITGATQPGNSFTK